MLGYPILLDNNLQPKTILENAYDIFIKDELLTDNGGYEILEFKIPLNDLKRNLIHNEDIIEVNNRRFIVRIMEDSKEDISTTKIYCEAIWYDLNDPEPINNISFNNVGPKIVLDSLLENTDWQSGVVEITTPRDFNISEAIVLLKAIRQLVSIYGGELEFDTKNMKVNLKEKLGNETNILFTYFKNTEQIKRIIDTRNLITRLYMTGANGITIASVNNGIPYLENYEWFDKLGKPRVLKVLYHSDERFYNPNYMKLWMENKLKEISQPSITYELKVALIDGYIPNLGDYVTVYDKELELSQRMRVVARTINILEPENSEITLESPLKSLASQLTMDTTFTSTMGVADAVQQAMMDVSMFNLLLNSRADDGFNYWINQGFEIDNTAGITGSSAFVCNGQLGMEKSLTQTIVSSNRDAFTLSAQVEVNNLVKGPNAEIGFEITFEYEDGTSETKFISLG